MLELEKFLKIVEEEITIKNTTGKVDAESLATYTQQSSRAKDRILAEMSLEERRKAHMQFYKGRDGYASELSGHDLDNPEDQILSKDASSIKQSVIKLKQAAS